MGETIFVKAEYGETMGLDGHKIEKWFASNAPKYQEDFEEFQPGR